MAKKHPASFYEEFKERTEESKRDTSSQDWYIDYAHKLNEEELRFINQFKKEFHGAYGHTGKKNELLTTEEGQKFTNRQMNNNKRDAFLVSLNRDALAPYWDTLNYEDHADLDWLEVYKYFGPKVAEEFINEMFDKDIEEGVIDPDLTESRRLITLKKLKTIDNRRGRHKCKRKKR